MWFEVDLGIPGPSASNIRMIGATSGYIDISANPTTTDYAVTMPAIQGTLHTFLRNDGSGGLTWEPATLASVEQIITNNQSSEVSVSGFFVDPNEYYGFSANILINRTAPAISGDDAAFYANTPTGLTPGPTKGSVEQSDGKMIFIGNFSSVDGSTNGKIARFNADGTPDSAFNSNISTGFNFDVNAIALQSDGKIIVGGNFSSFNGNTRNYICRLNADGTDDSSFYSNVGSGFNGFVYSIGVQSDGKIIVGGAFTSLNGNTVGYIARIASDGTPDTGFDINAGTGFDANVRKVLVQGNDKILCGGSFTFYSTSTVNRFAEINADGTITTGGGTFNDNFSSTGFNAIVFDAFVDSNGKILVGGGFTSLNGNARKYLVRLNADGTDDSAFYSNLDTGVGLSAFAIVGFAEQADGKYLVGGTLLNSLNGTSKTGMIRLNSDGSEDTGFADLVFNGDVNSFIVQGDGFVGSGGFSTSSAGTRNHIFKYGTSPSGTVIKQYTMHGFYNENTSQWSLGEGAFIGDDPGVTLTMTNAGQLQYTSTDIPGTTTSLMRFTVEKL